ncbi:Dehydroquinate synthase-like protein [Schizophyllum commune H4-8]|uniref:Alcohol dehydrogenase iron-type/glycerol dehydrogenase GldA domain-containing protein n=1 Tax=Schizophyllum commune (strain H4-8 / FGSC 9210) TaxID=578458 RepID=D8PMV5_SCHCM|nr:Dehydroquinate synthase-like protein [Schizophyllum commune H4-8]KAI5893042.1 Dehydroquinate synthase-like protein [Schizophyllum commune H4-8]
MFSSTLKSLARTGWAVRPSMAGGLRASPSAVRRFPSVRTFSVTARAASIANRGITFRVFQSPAKYVQGPSAIRDSAQYLRKMGKRAVLITDDIVHQIAGEDLINTLSEFEIKRAAFTGIASVEEVERIKEICVDFKADFVIALGGGKTIDVGKTVTDDLKIEVAIMPTTASTDAPCSANAVLYRPSGDFDRYAFCQRNPYIVIVDTSIIARAPARLLAAGMGDALATNVEAKRARNAPNFGGGMPALVADAICEKCEETLFKYGKQAYEACKVNAMTPALEAIVEANTLLSGLGFESGGLAAAHAIHDGLTSIHRLHHLLHGEKVAFGTICQLVLDGAPQDEIDRYLGFLLSVDLPVTFDMMGIPDVTAEELHKVAEIACAPGETIWNMDSVITPDVVFQAILGADIVGREYIDRTGFKQLSTDFDYAVIETRPHVSRSGTVDLLGDLKVQA